VDVFFLFLRKHKIILFEKVGFHWYWCW